MRVEPEQEFAAFCDAVRGWLAVSPSLDPSLAAVMDVLGAPDTRLTTDASDAHRCLGITTLLTLWQAAQNGSLAAR